MDDFKQGMRQLAGAVTVVTAGINSEIAGLTATAVCSLTASPPRLLACLNMNGTTFELLRRHARFCVNVIGEHDQAIAETFAGMTQTAPDGKFGVGQWAMATDRAPRLLSAIVAFECNVHSVTMLATHGLVIGDVSAVHIAPGSGPLLYHEGQFAGLAHLIPA